MHARTRSVHQDRLQLFEVLLSAFCTFNLVRHSPLLGHEYITVMEPQLYVLYLKKYVTVIIYLGLLYIFLDIVNLYV